MKRFEIFSWQPPGWPEPHPCVIVSHPTRGAHKPDVEVVICSTQRAARKSGPHQVILDEADGLDWQTLCKCDQIFSVPRGKLSKRRGTVTPARQLQIVRTIIAAHGWGEIVDS